MKFSKRIALLVVTTAGLSGLIGCKSNAKMPVNFVAVTSNSYNAEVQFGDYDYKFQGKINQGSNKFTLAGTAVARHATSSGGGQGGFPGGGGCQAFLRLCEAPVAQGFQAETQKEKATRAGGGRTRTA